MSEHLGHNEYGYLGDSDAEDTDRTLTVDVEEFFTNEHDRRAWERCRQLAGSIKDEGGQAMLVGGGVRDVLFGKSPKDLDVEVYRIEPDQLRTILDGFVSLHHGRINEVGAAFGIVKIALPDRDGDSGGSDIDLDVSLPRTENRIGVGHKDFAVAADPWMSIEEAASRRDFTINSLAMDVLTGEIYDHFGGVEDLQAHILRVTDEEKFREDPLRVLRGMQFVARMGLTADSETADIMKSMVPELRHLPAERLKEEWTKLFLKSERPSIGLEAAKDWGVLAEMHPILDGLSEVLQDKEWHPEGDVWTHTLMAVDKAAQITKHMQKDEKLAVMLGALCHDLGKITATSHDSDGRIRSHGHDTAGAELTKQLLKEMGFEDKDLSKKVVNLVTNHMAPTTLYEERDKIKDGAIRRLATRIYPASIPELVAVTQADYQGRGRLESERASLASSWLLERAVSLQINVGEKPKPIIGGRDLMEMGLSPGKYFGEILKNCERLNYLGLDRPTILGIVRQVVDNHGVSPEWIIEAMEKEIIALGGEI